MNLLFDVERHKQRVGCVEQQEQVNSVTIQK
jgi:hypothetical protein